MKITRVEIIPQDIPQKTTFRTSTGAITPGNFVILKIQTDEGLEGVGSSGGFAAAGQDREASMVIMRNVASKALLGQDPLNTDLLLNRVEALLGENIIGVHSRIMAHFDYALYDLKGKILNVPVYQLLGGLSREKIPLEWIVVMDEPEKQAEMAVKYINAGFHSLKVHVGTELKMAVKRFKTIREAVGPDIPMGIDIAGAWRAPDALRLIEALVPYDIHFAEDPAWPLDVDGFAAVKRGTSVPLIADRDARSAIEALNLIKTGSADIFHCLLDKVGGIRAALRYSGLIEAAGLDYAICVMGAGISHAAGSHFAVSRAKNPGVNDEIGLALYIHGAMETKGITTDVTKELSGRIEKGYLYPPKGPGLGVELHEENIKRYMTPGLSTIVVE